MSIGHHTCFTWFRDCHSCLFLYTCKHVFASGFTFCKHSMLTYFCFLSLTLLWLYCSFIFFSEMLCILVYTWNSWNENVWIFKTIFFYTKEVVVHYSLILSFKSWFLICWWTKISWYQIDVQGIWDFFFMLICIIYMYILIKYSGVTSSSITQFQSHFEFLKNYIWYS